MCSLDSVMTNQQAIRTIAKVMIDHIGNLQPLPEVRPNTMAPIIRDAKGDRELVTARWGMPMPPGLLKDEKVDRDVTNIWNTEFPWWRRWLDAEHRCLVPLTAFAGPEHLPEGALMTIASLERPRDGSLRRWNIWNI